MRRIPDITGQLRHLRPPSPPTVEPPPSSEPSDSQQPQKTTHLPSPSGPEPKPRQLAWDPFASSVYVLFWLTLASQLLLLLWMDL